MQLNKYSDQQTICFLKIQHLVDRVSNLVIDLKIGTNFNLKQFTSILLQNSTWGTPCLLTDKGLLLNSDKCTSSCNSSDTSRRVIVSEE